MLHNSLGIEDRKIKVTKGHAIQICDGTLNYESYLAIYVENFMEKCMILPLYYIAKSEYAWLYVLAA